MKTKLAIVFSILVLLSTSTFADDEFDKEVNPGPKGGWGWKPPKRDGGGGSDGIAEGADDNKYGPRGGGAGGGGGDDGGGDGGGGGGGGSGRNLGLGNGQLRNQLTSITSMLLAAQSLKQMFQSPYGGITGTTATDVFGNPLTPTPTPTPTFTPTATPTPTATATPTSVPGK